MSVVMVRDERMNVECGMWNVGLRECCISELAFIPRFMVMAF